MTVTVEREPVTVDVELAGPVVVEVHDWGGPPGPAGPAGPQGPSGPPGATGASGTGAPGPAGAQGPPGAPGAQGAVGAQGPSGPTGPTGAKGDKGATGAQGPQGLQGIQGPQGIQGAPAAYPTVADFASLGSAVGKAGAAFYVTATKTVYVSDGAAWHIAYGDTGWRVLTSWNTAGTITGDPLAAGWKPRSGVGGGIAIRRVGNTVTLAISSLAIAVANPADAITTLPLGFRPIVVTAIGFQYLVPVFAGSALKGYTIGIAATGVVTEGGNIVGAVDDYFFGAQVTFPTSDAWPATLPGTGTGTIP